MGTLEKLSNGQDYREYIEHKYKGKVIEDPELDRVITVKSIMDLRFDDLEFEDQRMAMMPHIGWAWGVSDNPDPLKAKRFKAYLFRPKQRQFFWTTEKYPAYIGAFGSGKSLVLWLKAIQKSLTYPGTRGLYMRATYPQLQTASLPTLWKIFDYFGWVQGKHYEHISGQKIIKLNVGKNLVSEIIYRPAKNEGVTIDQAIQDLRSLEIDYACIDEIADIDEQIALTLGNRVGRWGKITNKFDRQMLVAGNPPQENSWIHLRWYKKKEKNGTLLRNPNSHALWVSSTYENMRNLPKDYIEDLESRPEWFRKAYLYGDLGFQPPDGIPVFGEFDYSTFVRPDLLPNPDLPIIRGWDLGPTAKNKACVICQLDPKGTLLVLAEVIITDPGIRNFIQHVKMKTNELFPTIKDIKDFTDPVAFHTSQTDGRSAADIAREEGLIFYPGEERVEMRLEAVNQVMQRYVEGHPGMLIDKNKCPTLIAGFMGGYRHKVIDEESGRYSLSPIKDKWADIQDALQYACSRLAFVNTKERDMSRAKIRSRNRALINKRKKYLARTVV